MAIHAETIWEIRTSGNNSNGGGWRDYGGASVDYSDQDAAQLNLANCSVSGTTLTDDDSGGVFTAAMVGSVVNIVGRGRYQISAFIDTDNVTLESAPSAGSSLTIYVGGAVADWEQIDTVALDGNTVWIKLGTYTLAGNLSSNHSSAANPMRLRGYNSTRGDDPTGANRPIFACGIYNPYFGQYSLVENIIFTINHTVGVMINTGGRIKNCKSTNTNASAAAGAVKLLAGGVAIDCEVINASGYGLWLSATDSKALYCEAHGCHDGIYCAGANHYITFNNVWNCSRYGIALGPSSRALILHNTIDDGATGIYFPSAAYAATIMNNQITNNATKGINTAAVCSIAQAFLDYNNYNGNAGGDVNNVTKGDNATSDAPGYANQAGGDFSEVDDDNAFAVRLGVG